MKKAMKLIIKAIIKKMMRVIVKMMMILRILLAQSGVYKIRLGICSIK